MNIDESITIENIHYHYRKIIGWLIIGWVITVVAIAGIFMYSWCQYDYTSTTTTETISQDGEGVNNINNGTQGDVN